MKTQISILVCFVTVIITIASGRRLAFRSSETDIIEDNDSREEPRINNKVFPIEVVHVPRFENEGEKQRERRSTTSEVLREGRAANNYHALFEHYDQKGQPFGLNVENFIETGGCNRLPPNWQKRVSGARVCGGCIRLYSNPDCTGKRSSDLKSWSGCTFFQLYHFNDQASAVGACT
ncbi:unnamed protein product [Allacma fusca]|uniref:Uncharacterized protein n=1 Tax=Allacma fusca TaxID=39272 RepID=A0A8J2PD38_9HEXA|nr:unnamed protein product [Allacma fusca]